MVLDLLRGDESYKHRWTDRTRTLSEVWLSRPGRMNAAAAAWTLDLRSRMREAPVVGPAIVKGRWLARRLASLRSCSGDSSSCDDLDERQSNER